MNHTISKTIGQLDVATAIKGDEQLLIYQDGHTRSISIKELTEYFQAEANKAIMQRMKEAMDKIKKTGL